MRLYLMFVTAVCVLFLIKLRWPKKKTILISPAPDSTILDKRDGKFVTPLPPKSRMGKWRVLAFARFHACFGGDGGLLFHFILSKIVGLRKLRHVQWAIPQICSEGSVFIPLHFHFSSITLAGILCDGRHTLQVWQKRFTVLGPIRSNHLQTHRLFMVDPHRNMKMSVHFERGRSANS